MLKTHKLTWQSAAARTRAQQQAINALNEIDGRIETGGKRELYPGHGKRTGVMQRAIQAEPARVEGPKVRGRIAVKGVPYALRMHKRYQYLAIPLKAIKPDAPRILKKHMTND